MGLPERIRAYLTELARHRGTITYRDLAKALEVQPPNTIHQVTDALEVLMQEDCAPKLIFVILAVGFVPALIFAWAFELTAEGLMKEKDVDRSQPISHHTGADAATTIIVATDIAVLAPNIEKLPEGSTNIAGLAFA